MHTHFAADAGYSPARYITASNDPFAEHHWILRHCIVVPVLPVWSSSQQQLVALWTVVMQIMRIDSTVRTGTVHTFCILSNWLCVLVLNMLLRKLQAEIVLVTTERADGSAARIIYRIGATVNATELEELNTKVSWWASR